MLGTKYNIVIGVDGIQVRKVADLLNYIETKSVGYQVVLHVLRNVKTPANIKIVLAARQSRYDKTL